MLKNQFILNIQIMLYDQHFLEISNISEYIMKTGLVYNFVKDLVRWNTLLLGIYPVCGVLVTINFPFVQSYLRNLKQLS